MVEKVPDSTYEMVGGLDKQIKEIKEVSWSLQIKKIREKNAFYTASLKAGFHLSEIFIEIASELAEFVSIRRAAVFCWEVELLSSSTHEVL